MPERFTFAFMARIELSMGMFTLIDDSDLPLVSHWKWNTSCAGYAVHGMKGGDHVFLHRNLFGSPPGMDIDHINGDRLDNRRQNIRAVTRTENKRNVAESWPVVSQYLGVYRRFIWDRWFVIIPRKQGGQVYGGDYIDELSAARAYDCGLAHYYPGAETNFPDPVPTDQRSLLIANGQCELPASSYRGVAQAGGSKGGKYPQKWASQIYAGRTYKLGYFDHPEDAAQVYDAACLILGKPDRMNFPGTEPPAWAMERARSVISPAAAA